MRPYVLLLLWLFASAAVFAGPPSEPHFIENKNQWPEHIRFGADVRSGRILFASDRIYFSFWENLRNVDGKDGSGVVPHAQGYAESGAGTAKQNGHTYLVRFLNANPYTQVYGQHERPTRYNYLFGNDRSKWTSNAASFETLYYDDVYCDIDMRYYSEKGRMKYEWIVAPQVNPNTIRMSYEGLTRIYVDNENLHLETSVNEIWEMKPYAYQVVNGNRVEVMSRYVLNGNTVSYAFPDGYDECLPLIIDPILIFSAYSGSTLDNWGNTATYDERGNVYSGGIVEGGIGIPGYPITTGAFQMNYAGGAWDVGILKYDSSGSKLLYCTYLGGAGTETPQSLVVNEAGELLILGATSSPDFPVTNGTQFQGGTTIDPLGGVPYTGGTDIFVAKLSPDGDALLGATYLGGTSNDGVNFVSGAMLSFVKVESVLARNYGDQLRGDVLADADGYVYIASSTSSPDFPRPGFSALNTYSGGTHDAVLVKLSPDLSDIEWSRFIGGTETDAAYSVKLDSENNVFIAGGSDSPTIPGIVSGYKSTNTGNIDGWVMSFTNDGDHLSGTFLGTTQYDQAYFIDLNSEDEVFVFGQTLGTYVSGSTGRQFVHKLDHTLTISHWARVIGPGTISPTAFLVSDCGYIYLSGWGGAVNATNLNTGAGILTRNYIGGNTVGLPVTPDAYQKTTSGNDFYLLVLSEDGSENLYATFLGGSQSATHVDGGTSRFDKKGMVYHAVCAGCGGFSDFPAVNVSPLHRTNRSTNCNNAVFKFDLSLLKARLQTNSVKLDNPGLNRVCLEDPIVFQNLSNGGETFEWNLGDGTKFTKLDTIRFTHIYQQPGRYQIWLKAIDKGTCQVVDSATTFVDVFSIEMSVQDDDAMCLGDSYTLQASGADSYHWFTEDGSFSSGQRTPTISPAVTTKYYVLATEHEKCTHLDSVTINVIDHIQPEFETELIGNCNGLPIIRVANLTEDTRDADQIYFDFGDGNTSDSDEEMYQYANGGDYVIKLVGAREICVNEKTVPVTVQPLFVPNVITPLNPEGKNDTFVIGLGEDTGKTPADIGATVKLSIYNRWGRPIYSSDDYKNDWDGSGFPAGVYFYEVHVDNYGTCRSWVHVIR